MKKKFKNLIAKWFNLVEPAKPQEYLVFDKYNAEVKELRIETCVTKKFDSFDPSVLNNYLKNNICRELAHKIFDEGFFSIEKSDINFNPSQTRVTISIKILR